MEKHHRRSTQNEEQAINRFVMFVLY
jgi:hypothetical protein